MATIGDAMVTLLTDNWAGAAPTPTFGHLVDYSSDLPPSQEQVLVRLPVYDDDDPINDKFSNTKITLTIRIKTNVSDDRLKVLVDEVRRIVNSYAITGVTRQRTKGGENNSDRKRQVFSYDVRAICETHMTSGGTAYSSPGAGDVTFPNDVTITRDLAVGRDLAVTRNTTVGGTLGVTGVTTFSDESLTSTQIADLLMFGNANAAWVNCPCEPAYSTSWIYNLSGWISNSGANNPTIVFALPLPTNKTGLKLYISGVRVGLGAADAQAYVENTIVYGFKGDTRTQLDLNTTDLNSAGEHEDTFTAVDCSGEDAVKVILGCDVDVAQELKIGSVAVRSYYAT